MPHTPNIISRAQRVAIDCDHENSKRLPTIEVVNRPLCCLRKRWPPRCGGI